MISRDKLKWTEQDDIDMREYKRKIELGLLSVITFDEAINILKKENE